MFDSKSTLHKNNERYKNDPRFYRQWELCQTTNPNCITTQEEAFKDADVLVALSKPGPNTIKPEWIRLMAEKSIVFTCANPVPEIYP
jgi:malate dehydrogenase (oxaloacetate-decarboxylating)